MRKVSTLTVAVLFCIFVVQTFAFAREGRIKKAQEHLSDNEHAVLSLFILDKLSEGLKGEELFKAIHGKLNVIKKAHHGKKAGKKDNGKKGHGEALKHGLEEKDLVGLGKFVNEKLAEGLQGSELSEAIRTESNRRREERKKKRETMKAEKKGKRDKDHKGKKSDKSGKHGSSDKAGKGASHKRGRGH